jgi:Holliday junction resolvase RusA-like endonuclease
VLTRSAVQSIGTSQDAVAQKAVSEKGLVLAIAIESLPPKEFSPNSRVHYHVRHAAGVVAQDEVIARVSAYGYKDGALDNPVVYVVWGLPDKRRRDWDNLIACTKPLIDGLVHAGVLKDDSVRDYQPRYGWFDSPKHPRTEIRVYSNKQGE